jgi:hypothetical protein
LVCITPTGRIFLTCSAAVNNSEILASMRTDDSDFKINKIFTLAADLMNYEVVPLTSGAVLHDNGKIIFTTFVGGPYDRTILSFDTLTSTLTKIFSFPPTAGIRTLNAAQTYFRHKHSMNHELAGTDNPGPAFMGLTVNAAFLLLR